MKLFKLYWALNGFLAKAIMASTSVSGPGQVLESASMLELRTVTIGVNLPSGGIITGKSAHNVESFNAVPYADPPVGPLRLKPPRRFSGNFGKRDGTSIAPACPQMLLPEQNLGMVERDTSGLPDISFLKATTGQEDCLTLNVQRPAGTMTRDKLPVLFWIYGGAFQLGSTNTYDATSLLATAVSQDQPFIFIAVNYRVAGFGFMPGREILEDGSANIGLLDQRMGLEWVADNIAAFGGDPSKVTIWGESAGAISVFDQMALYDGNATYKGKPLFRGAIMNSGSIIPADPIDCPKGQAVYDQVVGEAGCAKAKDTLECLRQVDFKTFLHAVSFVPSIASHQSLALSYLPRPDGKVLTDSPEKLGEAGKYYAVPMIVGDQEDEGTIFAIRTPNITTVDRAVEYLSKYYFHSAPKQLLTEYVQIYEPALTMGSPFRTGVFNEIYPGFKRMAAILGDLTFTLTRRVALRILTSVKPNVPVWSYLSSYNYGTPFVGTFHASDILEIFYGILPNNYMKSCRTYYFNFLYNLDPNKGAGGYDNWPEWKNSNSLMWFRWKFANDILPDNFRSKAAEFIAKNMRSFYI